MARLAYEMAHYLTIVHVPLLFLSEKLMSPLCGGCGFPSLGVKNWYISALTVALCPSGESLGVPSVSLISIDLALLNALSILSLVFLVASGQISQRASASLWLYASS